MKYLFFLAGLAWSAVAMPAVPADMLERPCRYCLHASACEDGQRLSRCVRRGREMDWQGHRSSAMLNEGLFQQRVLEAG